MKNKIAHPRLFAGIAVLLLLCVLFCAAPRFSPSDVTLAELQASEAFQEAAAKLADPSVQLAWGEPLRYSRFFPGLGEVVCVPYSLSNPRAVGTSGSSDWTFSLGVLLWDAGREQTLDAADVLLDEISLQLTPDPNTALTRLYQDAKTGSAVLSYRDGAAAGEAGLGTSASTLDSAVRPDAVCTVTLDWSARLRPNRPLPVRGYPVSLSAQASYQNNVTG